jgi:putative membrane protein
VDREFMNEAASANLMEVALGRYATNHAASARVKEFGQTMVTDHTKANDDLKQVAWQKDVELPAKMSAKHRATVDRLTKMKGAEFDRAYMKTMLEDHQEDVGKFRQESHSAQDPDVKEYAAMTLPTLEHHLEMAKDISAQGGRATSGAGSRRD